MARYEEERYGGQRGSRGRGGYDRGRDDDFEQQERDRYRGSEFGRDEGIERGRGGYEESWRGRGERDTGRSLGARESGEGYDDEDSYGSSYSAGGREGNRYGSGSGQGSQGRWGSQRYGSQGYQGSQGTQGTQRYGGAQGYQDSGYQGSQGYRGSQGYQGSQGYGQASGFYGGQGSYAPGQGSYGRDAYGQNYYGQGSLGQSGQGYDEGTLRRGQGTWRGQDSWGGQQYGQGGRGSQADGWSGEPDEMRWGRQQGLYGSTEYGGYISSQRSQADYQSHVGKGPKGWQRSDERIREEVNETLARHPEVDASEIEVRVQNAEVTLTGTVDDRRTKRMVEDIVERVFGVKDVENKIKVKGRGIFGFGGDKDVTGRADKDTDESQTRRTPAATTPSATTGSTAGTTGNTNR